jgi:putative pyruvate formate lyase activating enzyme
LTVPVVYNTGGYDSPAALEAMDGLIDVYLPDVKFRADTSGGRDSASRRIGRRYFGASNYQSVNEAAVREMHRRVGPLVCNDHGVARRGLLVRHLVLPENLAGTDRVLAWLAEELGPGAWISLMAQYRPMRLAESSPDSWPELARPLSVDEYEAAVDRAVELGLENVFVQDLGSSEVYVPDFDSGEVFSRTD